MSKQEHEWKWFREGRMGQVKFENGEDVAALASLDAKQWLAISCPTTGVRFDLRMLELMDSDHDGHIRTPEVIAAIEFLKSRDVDFNDLFTRRDEDVKALDAVLERQGDLAKVKPSADEVKALADWEKKAADVAVAGEGTAAAEAALAAVEPVIDGFFTPPEDMPLVTEELDKELPLRDHINPRHLEAILDFAEKCVKPVLGADKATLTRIEWKRVKAAFAPYREWIGSKPVMCAGAKSTLEDEERLYRYKLNLLEFLENYVNMRRLYREDSAIFQTGVLKIDARELKLCFHVADEAAHSALAEKSKCCILYLKLKRPSEGAERTICAVVTAGTVGQLYVGRNGVFFDRDGKDWEATVSKVVESQVSLKEAFWAPWRKLGEGVAAAVKKFLGDKQAKATENVQKGTESAQAGGAAMASSVAAIGIGIGMVGAAMASILAAVKSMGPSQLAIAIVALVLVVSLPSVILTYFKLRQRDLGAILNASGWAVNRPMRFSMKRARAFTKCAKNPFWWLLPLFVLLAIALVGGGMWWFNCRQKTCACEAKPAPAPACAAQPAAAAPAPAPAAK